MSKDYSEVCIGKRLSLPQKIEISYLEDRMQQTRANLRELPNRASAVDRMLRESGASNKGQLSTYDFLQLAKMSKLLSTKLKLSKLALKGDIDLTAAKKLEKHLLVSADKAYKAEIKACNRQIQRNKNEAEHIEHHPAGKVYKLVQIWSPGYSKYVARRFLTFKQQVETKACLQSVREAKTKKDALSLASLFCDPAIKTKQDIKKLFER